MTFRFKHYLSFFSICFCAISIAEAAEFNGYVGAEIRAFPHEASASEQDHKFNASMMFEPEFYHEWDDGRQLFETTLFARIDDQDHERTHFDIRELSWTNVAEAWELRLGIRKVFWGVAESAHLVDIINQTDLIENLDTEDKLGQPMLNLALVQDWGTVDFFVLPYFRERTFAGAEGRLRSHPRVDVDQAIYESAAEKNHIDFAIRYSHYFGDFDIGLSHFYGTSREPRFLLGTSGIEPVLIPYYDIIQQTGIDLQATKGDWLWKLEVIYRQGQPTPSGDDRFFALVGGFEYSFIGVFDSSIDVGVIGEYIYDDRDKEASTPFEDDLVTGVRIALNDVQSTEILAGVTFDLDSDAKFFNVEASRRLGDSWKLELESRFFSSIPTDDVQYLLRNDDVIQFSLSRYF